MIRTVAVLALLAIATPSLAADPVKVPATSDPNKVRCKRESVTGSLAGSKKECHTEAEWHELAAQARSDTLQMQTAASRGGTGN